MDEVKKIKRVEDDVKNILKDDLKARCDDMSLYASYVFMKCGGLDSGITEEIKNKWLIKAFSDFRFRHDHDIAKYDTVGRCRRRLQSHYAELCAPDEVKKERKELERAYRLYSKGGVVHE